jgi:hypothetical protein
MKKKQLILNLEWRTSESRDRVPATMIANYLRYLGYEVVEGSIFYGRNLLKILKPDLLYITNGIGAPENYAIVKYAKYLGIKVLTLVSEGNFLKTGVKGMTWGWNSEKILNEDIHLQWSKRSRDMMVSEYPEVRNMTYISGGCGFDQYQLQFDISSEIKLKFDKDKYSKIVGYGCHDFGVALEGDTRFKPESPEKEIRRKIRDDINRTLINVVGKNPDILFIFKQHPGVQLGQYASGIEGLEKYPNTIILKNEYSIRKCIEQSDIWISFWSTTFLEAWLLGKNTIAYLPPGALSLETARYNVTLKGTPIVHDLASLDKLIKQFYKEGKIDGFDVRGEARNEIIEKVIMWGDGLNHVRAGNKVIELLNRPEITMGKLKRHDELFLRLKEHILWNLSGMLRYLPKFDNYYLNKKSLWKQGELKNVAEKYYNAQIEYYTKKELSKEKLRDISCM